MNGYRLSVRLKDEDHALQEILAFCRQWGTFQKALLGSNKLDEKCELERESALNPHCSRFPKWKDTATDCRSRFIKLSLFPLHS